MKLEDVKLIAVAVREFVNERINRTERKNAEAIDALKRDIERRLATLEAKQ